MIPIHYKKLTSRKFGVELEMGEELTRNEVLSLLKPVTERKIKSTGYQQTETVDSWHIKTDSTCGSRGHHGPKGIEVASFVGSGEKDLQHIADVAEHLHNHGCRTNNNCGLHVHVDASDLSEIHVGRIMAHWIKLEGLIGSALPWRRLFSGYCQSVHDRVRPSWLCKKWGPTELYHNLAPDDLRPTDNKDRWYSLNLVNYERACAFKIKDRKTLEFRWPEGTLSGPDVKGWTRLFISFVDSCKDRAMPGDLYSCSAEEGLRYLGLGHPQNFFYLFSDGLHETRTWFLERILKYNCLLNLHDYAGEAKSILNRIWSPVRIYS